MIKNIKNEYQETCNHEKFENLIRLLNEEKRKVEQERDIWGKESALKLKLAGQAIRRSTVSGKKPEEIKKLQVEQNLIKTNKSKMKKSFKERLSYIKKQEKRLSKKLTMTNKLSGLEVDAEIKDTLSKLEKNRESSLKWTKKNTDKIKESNSIKGAIEKPKCSTNAQGQEIKLVHRKSESRIITYYKGQPLPNPKIFNSNLAAEEYFDKLSRNQCIEEFYFPEDYEEEAKKFLDLKETKKNAKKNFTWVPKTLSFLIAVLKKLQEFKIASGSTKRTAKAHDNAISKMFLNDPLPKNRSEFKCWVKNHADKLLQRGNTQRPYKILKDGRIQGEPITIIYGRTRLSRFQEIMGVASDNDFLFDTLEGADDYLANKRIRKELISKNLLRTIRTSDGIITVGTLVEEEHYPPILNHPSFFEGEDNVERQNDKILELYRTHDRYLFNFQILSETTCLRPEEMRRLINNIPLFFRNGNLHYEVKNPENDKSRPKLFLIQESKYNPKNREAIRASLVAVLILKGDKAVPFTTELKVKNSGLRIFDYTNDIHERRNRPTGLTGLNYSASATNPIFLPITQEQIILRPNHMGTQMLNDVYASYNPSGNFSPEEYYGMENLTVMIRGQNIAEGSILWDAYLLKKYVDAKMASLRTQKEKSDFEDFCLAEWQAYLKRVRWKNQKNTEENIENNSNKVDYRLFCLANEKFNVTYQSLVDRAAIIEGIKEKKPELQTHDEIIVEWFFETTASTNLNERVSPLPKEEEGKYCLENCKLQEVGGGKFKFFVNGFVSGFIKKNGVFWEIESADGVESKIPSKKEAMDLLKKKSEEEY